jgi:hypothetical protein
MSVLSPPSMSPPEPNTKAKIKQLVLRLREAKKQSGRRWVTESYNLCRDSGLDAADVKQAIGMAQWHRWRSPPPEPMPGQAPERDPDDLVLLSSFCDISGAEVLGLGFAVAVVAVLVAIGQHEFVIASRSTLQENLAQCRRLSAKLQSLQAREQTLRLQSKTSASPALSAELTTCSQQILAAHQSYQAAADEYSVSAMDPYGQQAIASYGLPLRCELTPAAQDSSLTRERRIAEND